MLPLADKHAKLLIFKPWRRKVPGGAAGLQNQFGGRKVPGGFDSLPSPPKTVGKIKHYILIFGTGTRQVRRKSGLWALES
jgi:hypothetical protein